MIEYTSKYNVRTTMYQQFENSANQRGDNPCLYYYNNTLSWNEVSAMIDKCAAALAANGVKKGDRVVVCLPNTPQCVAAIYAINKIGAIASMLHPLSVKSEADYAIKLVGAKFAFCFDVSEKAFKDNPDVTVVKCPTAQYFPKTPYGLIANMIYKKKIKGKTAPATNVKKLIDWFGFLKEGEAYIKENGVPETAQDSLATAAIMMTGGTTGNPKGVMLTSEAINNLNAINPDSLEQQLLFDYYIAYFTIYSYWADYCSDDTYSPIYKQRSIDYMKKAMANIDKHNEAYHYYMGEYYVYVDKNDKKALKNAKYAQIIQKN